MPVDSEFGPFLDAIEGVFDDLKDLRPVNKDAAEAVRPFADKRAADISGRLKRSGRTSGTKRAGALRYGRKSTPWAAPAHFGHFRRPQGGFMVGNFYAFEGLAEGEPEAVEVYEDFTDSVLSRHF